MRRGIAGARCERVSFTSDFTKRDHLIIEIGGVEIRTVDRRHVGDLWLEAGEKTSKRAEPCWLYI